MSEPAVPPSAPRPVTVAPFTPADPAARAVIEIDHVDFNYGPAKTLHDVTLNVAERQVTAFIGPSGCGKSTLLRVLNRMYDLYPGQRATGDVLFDVAGLAETCFTPCDTHSR